MRFILLGLSMAALVLAPAPLVRGQDEPRAVVARAVEALGGQSRLTKIRAIQFKIKAIYWLGGGCLPDQIVRINRNLSDGREMARVFSGGGQENESRAIRRWLDCVRVVREPDCTAARFATRSVVSLSAARDARFPS